MVFIDWYLPGTRAGGPVRSVANLVDHLAGELDFSIVTRDNDYCSNDAYPGITPGVWLPAGSHCRVMYLSPAGRSMASFRRLIRETPCETVWINGIYSPLFSILPLLLLQGKGKRILVSPRGMMNPQAFTTGRLKKKSYLLLGRWAGLFRNVIFHAASDGESRCIQATMGSGAQVVTAPNLPRKRAFRVGGGEASGSDSSGSAKQPGVLRLVSVARIAPEKGTLRALRLLERLSEGEIRFDLYGPVYDQDYWRQCLEVMARLPGHVRVTWHGPAEAEQVGELLSAAHFLLLPTEGENFGHAILEALSAGCPVIISDRTPWRNLAERQAGFDLPVEDSPAFCGALEQALAMDEATYRRWSEGALRLAREYHESQAPMNANRLLFLQEKRGRG